MRTYTSLHYHVIYSTLGRTKNLDAKWRSSLFEYVSGTIRGLGGFPEGVGGWVEHIHILMGLKADHRLSDMIREIKKASTRWVKETHGLKNFAWQEGYGAFTVGYRERPHIKQYIMDQEKHHQKTSYLEEVIRFYEEAGVPYDPRYLS